MVSTLGRFCRDRSGATAIEYVFIAGLIACAIIATVRSTGTNVAGIFTAMAGRFN